MKNVSMYDKHIIGKPIIELNRDLWTYNYCNNRSVFPNSRYGVSESSLSLIQLTPFNYKGIDFNMITCPAGQKVDIEDWGVQEIKEPFMLGETEVTVELFEAVMGFNKSHSKNKQPIIACSWFDCLSFCNKLSNYFDLDCRYELRDEIYVDDSCLSSIKEANTTFIERTNGFRLPKQWEWQVAAMAGTNNKFAGANDDESLKRFAWFDYNSLNQIFPVAQKLPNEWGFYDMSGNVREFCENSVKPNENNHPSAQRVWHGGCFDDTHYLLTKTRGYSYPSERGIRLGFRVAKSI